MSRDEVYLRHIVEALGLIGEYVAVCRERCMAEPQSQDAIMRRLEIAGEATKRLSPELRARYTDVEWRSVAAMRDVLAHDYMGIDLLEIWETATRRVPRLKLRIEAILDEVGDPSK